MQIFIKLWVELQALDPFFWGIIKNNSVSEINFSALVDYHNC